MEKRQSFYSHPDKQGIIGWPGATAECQYYFNRALTFFPKNVDKGMFFLGAALHLVQDMGVHTIPWGLSSTVTKSSKHGQLKTGINLRQQVACIHFLTQPNGLIIMLAFLALYIPWYHMRKGVLKGAIKPSEILIPLTIATSAGFLDFAYKRLDGLTLRPA